MINFKMMSGLPRSGSTLMRGILEQHPQLVVSPYSGLREVLEVTRLNWNQLTPHKAFRRPQSLERVLKATLENYHEPDKCHVDYDRGWTSYIRQYEYLTGEKAKIVCMVRPIVEIIASMEKLKINNPLENLNIPINNDTMDERVASYLNGFVGLGYRSLVDCFENNFSDRVLLIDYNKLMIDPSSHIEMVLEFWGIDSFEPDYTNLSLSLKSDDNHHGFTKLHNLNTRLERQYVDIDQILSSRIIKHINDDYPTFWRNFI